MIPARAPSARGRDDPGRIAGATGHARPRAPRLGAEARGRRSSAPPVARSRREVGYAAPVPDAASPLAALSRRWEHEALRRAALWFGIACAGLPAYDILDGRSVVDALLAAPATGSWPGVSLQTWGLLIWIIGIGAAAGWLLGWLAPRPRMRLFLACAAMHLAYACATGLRLAALAAGLVFAYSFFLLRSAGATWPEGHPGAPQ